jgi:Phage capsid family
MALSFAGNGALMVPAFAAAAANASFIVEGAPIPVRQLVGSSVVLSPRKLAVITTFSRDVFEYSVPNIEEIVGRTLSESVGAALDAVVFDANAGDTARPAGLLASIAATGASAITVDSEAMHDDLGTLAALVAPVCGNTLPVFICSPKQATAIRTRIPNIGYTVLTSSALAAGTIVCIAPAAIVSVMGPPRIQVARDATLHMDSAATAISTVTTAPFAVPLRSSYQTATIGLRVVMEIGFGLRSATGLAWTQSVVW